MATSVLMGGTLIAVTLFIGISGYHWIAGFDLVDSILKAVMILGRKEPANSLATACVKVFASGYTLFIGLIFLVTMGIIHIRLPFYFRQ